MYFPIYWLDLEKKSGRSPPPQKKAIKFGNIRFLSPLKNVMQFSPKETEPTAKCVECHQELGDVHGTVPLHLAALRGHLEVVQTLVLAGRRWEWEDGKGAWGGRLKPNFHGFCCYCCGVFFVCSWNFVERKNNKKSQAFSNFHIKRHLKKYSDLELCETSTQNIRL